MLQLLCPVEISIQRDLSSEDSNDFDFGEFKAR